MFSAASTGGVDNRQQTLSWWAVSDLPAAPQPGLATVSIFFCFFFVKINLQINDPSSWETLFSSVPPSNSLVSVSDN